MGMSLVIRVFGHHKSTGQAQTPDLIMVLDKLLRQKYSIDAEILYSSFEIHLSGQ